MPTAAPPKPGYLQEHFPEVTAEEPTELITAVRNGLPAERFVALLDVLGISSSELADVVGISQSTLSRRKRSGRFKPDESGRLLRIAQITHQAIDVMDGVENAQKWLTEPSRALGGHRPLQFSDTEPGAHEVERLLIRLEHGVFS